MDNYGVFCTFELVIMIGVLIAFVYRAKLIELEDKIRLAAQLAFRRVKADGRQVVRVVNDFYGREK